MDLMSTIKGSNLEHYFPKGWDLKKIDECCSHDPSEVLERQPFWNKEFEPVIAEDITELNVMMGHEIALTIKEAKDAGKQLAIVFPVGPMGMYKWTVYFLKAWNVDCKHVWGFNMDEWADSEGNTLEPTNPGGFQNAMQNAFYGPLGELTVPVNQRNFATHDNLPTYAEKIAVLKRKGALLTTVYGIGRDFHIAFWEPHFAEEFATDDEWKKQTFRLGGKLNPMSVEQNALHSFRSRITQVPAFANTIGPGIFLKSDKTIGGCDGAYERGMMWQGMSLWTALRYGPTRWVPASYMPTMAGKLFFLKELAGPLVADVN